MHTHTDPDPHKDTVKMRSPPLEAIKRETVLNTLSRRGVKAQPKILLRPGNVLNY